MRNLEFYLENPFPKITVGLDLKKKFGESHLVNLTVQNTTGTYTQAIIDTTAAQQGMFGGITNVNLTRALQKTDTENVDRIILAFTKRNSRLNSYFKATELDKTPLYDSFFPQGVMQFTEEVNKGNVEQRMSQIHGVMVANPAAVGGATVVAEYAAFLSDYVITRTLQLTKIGEVSQGITNRENAEEVWENQLFSNLLLIATNNMGNPDIINDFFDQSIVNGGKQYTFNGLLQSLVLTFVVEHHFLPAATFRFKKTGAGDIWIYLSDSKDNVGGTPFIVTTDDEIEVNVALFNVDLQTHKYILVRNQSATELVEYKLVL